MRPIPRCQLATTETVAWNAVEKFTDNVQREDELRRWKPEIQNASNIIERYLPWGKQHIMELA